MAKTFDPTSFTLAKSIVFDRLVAAIGKITTLNNWTAANGVNSFNGFLPPAFDCWAITFGGGGDVRQTWNTNPPFELWIQADVEGQFRNQETADEVGMKILSALSMRWIDRNGAQVTQTDNHLIQTFRLRTGGNIDVFLGDKLIANEGPIDPNDHKAKPVLLWILKIGLELVFNTWT